MPSSKPEGEAETGQQLESEFVHQRGREREREEK